MFELNSLGLTSDIEESPKNELVASSWNVSITQGAAAGSSSPQDAPPTYPTLLKN